MNYLTGLVIPLLILLAIGVTVALIVVYGFPKIDGGNLNIGSIFSSLFVAALGVGAVSQAKNSANVVSYV